MTKEFSAQRLDVKAFAQAGGRLAGHDSLLKYERLAQEAKGLHPDLLVDWEATGEIRTALGGIGQVWLHIKVRASFPMECQRCLTPVDVPLAVERSFRFVADEALLKRWGEAMARLFPDVKPGDHILGVYRPEGAVFLFNGQALGEIAEAAFARQFFAIWLDPRTSAPELREALLRRAG